MARYKPNATEYVNTVRKDSKGQTQTTVPKPLMDLLAQKGILSIHGYFNLTENELKLVKECTTITVEQLCDNLWAVPDVKSIEEVNKIVEVGGDWDYLMKLIGINVEWVEGQSVVIVDWDSTTYPEFHVSFGVEA